MEGKKKKFVLSSSLTSPDHFLLGDPLDFLSTCLGIDSLMIVSWKLGKDQILLSASSLTIEKPEHLCYKSRF